MNYSRPVNNNKTESKMSKDFNDDDLVASKEQVFGAIVVSVCIVGMILTILLAIGME